MTRKPLLAFALAAGLILSAAAQAPETSAGTAVDDAIRESVRRQAWKIELQSKLAEAQQAQQKADHTTAVRRYEDCFGLLKQIGVNVDTERQQVVAGASASRFELARHAQVRGDLLEADSQIKRLLKEDPKN